MSDDTNLGDTEDLNQIFKGLKFFLSGKLSDGIEDLLVKNGGEKIEYFSDYVKICIVGEDPLETDLTDAKEIYEVPAVTEDWVKFSLHHKKQLEPKAFEIDNVLFKNMVLHCTQLSEDDTFAVLSLLFFHGGTFEKNIESRKITHMLCSAASGPKYEYVIRFRPNIKLVTPDWFMLSVQQKQLLDVTEYHPRLLIVPKPPPSPKPQQDLGDLSSITGFDDVDLPPSGEAEAPLTSGPEHPNLQQLKQRFPWMSPNSSAAPGPAKLSQSPHVSGATSGPMSSIMSQLRPPPPGPTSTSHHQIIMTQSAPPGGGGLPSQLKINVPSAVSSGGLSHLTDPMQQRIYVQQHLSQQQKQLLMQQHQKQQLLQQQQQQGLQLNVQWSRSHADGVIQQQQRQVLQPGQQQVLQQGQIIQRGQQIIQQTSQGQQIIQQTSQSQQIIQQTSQSQQIIQQGQQIIQGGQQIIQSQQMIQQGQQIIQQQSGGQQQIISQQQQQQQGGQSQQIIQQTQQIIQQGPVGQQQQIVQGGRIIAEHVIQQGRVIQEQVIQQGRVQLPPDQILAQGRVIQQPVADSQGSSQQSGGQSGGPLQMQQIIFRGRDGQQHILQQHYPPGSNQQGGVSQQGGQQQQWHFTQVRQSGPPPPPGQQQIVIQQQNQQHVLQQQQQQSQQHQQQNQQQQQQQQQILLQQQFGQQGQPGQGQQIFIQQPGNQQRTTNWTLVQQHQIPPRGQVLKLNARAHQQLQNMTPQEKSNFLSRLQQRHIIMQMQGQRPAGAIIRPGQQIATVIRHPTTGNWVQAPPGQINPQQQQQQQQQIILQQQQQGPGASSPQVRVPGPVQHVLQGHKPGGPGPTFTWNPASAGGAQGAPGPAPQGVESGPGGVPPQGGVVQQVGAGGVSMELIQLKQRQQMAKLLQQQQQLVQQQQQAKPSTTPLYNQVMEQTQAAAQSLTTPDLVSAHPGSDLNDASAAGQLRLMTAHHQAQLQSTHPVSSTQLYQSAPPSVPQQTPVVTPPRLSQQIVTSSSRSAGGGGGHSAAQRVAAVLAKSAAGQSVSAQHQQQMQHQQRAQFYGHNPNIKLPPEKCLLGCVFLVVEYDKQQEEVAQVEVWKQIILQNGGEVESSYVLRLTHILCLSQKHPLVHQGLRDGKRCITAHWLNDVVTRQHVLPPHLAIHFPTPFSDEKPCRSHYICATGFEKEERDRVRWMIEAIGAKYCSYYNSRIDFLVARKLEGDKVKRAKELQRPIVNVQWLNEVMFGHYACIQQHDSQKYQQYNLSHPFRIDYSLVLHLMGPWKVPINVSQEAYDRVKASPGGLGGPRRKKIKLSAPSEGGDTEDGENCELSALTLDPLPYENKPRILLSGFSKPEVEEKMIRQLGAEVATGWRDASHLVLASGCAGRTLKFLCAISRVSHVVNAAWLRASLQACHLLDEAEYTVKTIVVPHSAGATASATVKTDPDETKAEAPPRIVCDIPAVLARGGLRSRLFSGKVFYLSPSISPSPAAMREMILAAGGTVERQRRSWSKIPQDCMSGGGGFVPERATYLVVTCHKDLNLVADLLKHDYGIFNTEFVMTSIMTQQLDFSFVARRSDLERPRD